MDVDTRQRSLLISEYGPYWVPILCVKFTVTLQARVACFKPKMAGKIRYGLWWKNFTPYGGL